MALVKQAIARVAEVGMDKAMPEFMDHSGKFVDRDLYLIVIDKDGIRVVHGQNPKLVGKPYFDTVDVNGKEYGKEVQQIAAGSWQGLVHLHVQGPDHRQGAAEGELRRAGRRLHLSCRRLHALTRHPVLPRPAALGQGSDRAGRGRRCRRLAIAASIWLGATQTEIRLAEVADKALPTAAASARLLDAVDTIQAMAMRADGLAAGRRCRRRQSMRWARTSARGEHASAEHRRHGCGQRRSRRRSATAEGDCGEIDELWQAAR